MREVPLNVWRSVRVLLLALLVLVPAVAGMLAGSNAVSAADGPLREQAGPYTITASAGTGGSIDPPGAVSVADGANRPSPSRRIPTTTSSTSWSTASRSARVTSYTFMQRHRQSDDQRQLHHQHLHPHLHGRCQRLRSAAATPQTVVNHGAERLDLVTAVPNTGYRFRSAGVTATPPRRAPTAEL